MAELTLEQAAHITTGAAAEATIENDDTAALSISAAPITEKDVNQTTIGFTVTLDAAVEAGFDVAFHDLHTGTATVGADYTVNTSSPLSWNRCA